MTHEVLKKKVKDSGLKKSFIAKKIGVSNVWFSYFLNGHKDMSEDRKDKLNKLLEG